MNLIEILKDAGFEGERLREAWAIVKRESGGRPDAHNTDASTGDNSYGLFQINMLGNLGPERDAKFKKYVKGYTGKESLFDPVINARAAAYMSQKGNNWQSWVSPTYGAAAKYLKEFPGEKGGGEDISTGKSKGSKETYSSGTYKGTDPMYQAPDKLKMKDLKASYGIVAGILKNNTDLQDVLRKIIKGQVTDPARQIAMLNETDWFKKHSTQWMEIEKSRHTKDPAIWEAAIDRRADAVKKAYTASGAEISDADARDMAEKLIYGSGWNGKDFEYYDEQWLQETIASSIDFTKTKMIDGVEVYDLQGAAADWSQKLYDTAYQYAVDSSMSNDGFNAWFQKTLGGLMDGSLDESNIDDELQQMAMSRFPGLAPQLQRGMSVRQAADPYINVLADQWEMDASSFDINDDTLQQILGQTDESGKFKPMSLYDAKLAARRSPNWQHTTRAKEEYTSIGSKILKDFGFLG